MNEYIRISDLYKLFDIAIKNNLISYDPSSSSIITNDLFINIENAYLDITKSKAGIRCFYTNDIGIATLHSNKFIYIDKNIFDIKAYYEEQKGFLPSIKSGLILGIGVLENTAILGAY